MKKLLSLLGAIALVGSAGTTVVACGSKTNPPPKNNPAQDLANQIKNKDVALIAGSNTDTSNAATNKAIKDAVQTNNKLKSDQMKNITITKVTLKDNEQANTVKANIKIGKDTASVNLNVEIHSTAAQIKAKLDDVGRLGVTFISTDDNLSQPNIDKILTIVKTNNPQLSKFDQDQISITTASAGSLTAKTKEPVTLKITSDAAIKANTQTTLEVARFANTTSTADGNKYKAFQLADKIGLELLVATPAGTSTTLATAATAIKAALKKANPTLTADDISKISAVAMTSGTWSNAEANNLVTVTFTEGTGGDAQTATAALAHVVIHRTAAQIKSAINGITSQNVDIAGPAGETGTGTIDAQILAKLKTEASISDWDLTQITIPSKVALSTTRTAVTLKIKDDATPTPGDETQVINVKTAS